MKAIAFALLLAAAIPATAADSFFPGSAAAVTNAETLIDSDSVDFDLKSRQAVYHGNVRVQDPRVGLTCDRLTAHFPNEGKRVDSIIAESNVVILLPDKGVTNRATAARAVYLFQVADGKTNETLELTGSPAIETPQGRMTGDSILWDRIADTIRATNQRMIYRTGTNAPDASSTNLTAEPPSPTP